mmetsp:Transcript_32963/g.94734  ORF Transcript_32963/g.94734 Transcript_32963/m.94734 type:complete len:255 (+) Transcript_32963:650-1414(+)
MHCPGPSSSLRSSRPTAARAPAVRALASLREASSLKKVLPAAWPGRLLSSSNAPLRASSSSGRAAVALARAVIGGSRLFGCWQRTASPDCNWRRLPMVKEWMPSSVLCIRRLSGTGSYSKRTFTPMPTPAHCRLEVTCRSSLSAAAAKGYNGIVREIVREKMPMLPSYCKVSPLSCLTILREVPSRHQVPIIRSPVCLDSTALRRAPRKADGSTLAARLPSIGPSMGPRRRMPKALASSTNDASSSGRLSCRSS